MPYRPPAQEETMASRIALGLLLVLSAGPALAGKMGTWMPALSSVGQSGTPSKAESEGRRVIELVVEIRPDQLNLAQAGSFEAVLEIPESYDGEGADELAGSRTSLAIPMEELEEFEQRAYSRLATQFVEEFLAEVRSSLPKAP